MAWSYIFYGLSSRAQVSGRLLTTVKVRAVDNREYTVLSLRRQLEAYEVRSIDIMRTKMIYRAANVYSFGYHSVKVITYRSQLAASVPAWVQLSPARVAWALLLA